MDREQVILGCSVIRDISTTQFLHPKLRESMEEDSENYKGWEKWKSAVRLGFLEMSGKLDI